MNNSKIVTLSPLSKIEKGHFITRDTNKIQMEYLYDIMHYQHKSIAISDNKKIEIIPISSIMYIQSSSNYSTFFLIGGKQKVTSKTLKYWQDKIEDNHFLRCHNSFLVNSKYVQSIHMNQSHLMVADAVVPISRSRKNTLIAYFT